MGTILGWNWQLDGASFSEAEYPDLSNITAGTHTLKLNATSSAGCISNAVTPKLYYKKYTRYRYCYS